MRLLVHMKQLAHIVLVDSVLILCLKHLFELMKKKGVEFDCVLKRAMQLD